MHVYLCTIVLLCCTGVGIAEETVAKETVKMTPALKPDEMYQDMFPLTSENFTEKVLRMKDPWIVIFHDGSLEKAWKTMATHLRGLCWVGLVDVTKDEEGLLSEINYDSSQDVARVYQYGGRLSKERDWKRVRTQNEARYMAISSIPDKTQKVNPSRMQDFLLEAFTSLPSRFPVYIITEEDETSAIFKALSVRFEKYFLFGLVVRPTQKELKMLGLGDTYITLPALYTIVTEDGNADKFNVIRYDVDSYGDMSYTKVMMYLFAVNGQFRHALPGENQSDSQKASEMSDILKIEGERFEVFRNQSKPKQPSKQEKAPAEKVAFKMTGHVSKDEL